MRPRVAPQRAPKLRRNRAAPEVSLRALCFHHHLGEVKGTLGCGREGAECQLLINRGPPPAHSMQGRPQPCVDVEPGPLVLCRKQEAEPMFGSPVGTDEFWDVCPALKPGLVLQ